MDQISRSRTRPTHAAIGLGVLPGLGRFPAVVAKAVVAWISVVAVVGACAGPVLAPGGSTVATATPKPADRIHVQARDALARWADAVRAGGGASITFTGALTSQIGEWEPEHVDNKLALQSGLIEAATELPTDTPSRREVKFLDGAKVEVGVLSATATLAALIASSGDGDCPGCAPLRITDAQLATGLVETSRGPAETPMWVFTIKGSIVRVTRVAVDESVTIVPPAFNAGDPPVGISIIAAVGTSDSRKLEVSFLGAVEDASDRCGADYSIEAIESELAVVVIVVQSAGSGPCGLSGRTRTRTLTLDERLGTRAVLEIRQGLPVPLLEP